MLGFWTILVLIFLLYCIVTYAVAAIVCRIPPLGSYGCTARPESISTKNNTNSSNPAKISPRLAGVRFANISSLAGDWC